MDKQIFGSNNIYLLVIEIKSNYFFDIYNNYYQKMRHSGIRIIDDKFQELGFKFESKVEGGKLIIRAFDKNNVDQYLGQMDSNPFINFNDVIKLLGERKLQIQFKDQTRLTIKIMQLIRIDFKKVNESVNWIDNHQDRMKNYQEKIKIQEQKIQNHQNILQQIFQELGKLRTSLTQEKKSRQVLTQAINKQILQKQALNIKINDISSQLGTNNETLTMQIIQMNELRDEKNQLQNSIKLQLRRVVQTKEIQLLKINKKIAEINEKLNRNFAISKDHKKVSQETLCKQDYALMMKRQFKDMLEQKSQKIIKQQKEQTNNKQLRIFNQTNKPMNWSKQLKSSNIKIRGNSIFMKESPQSDTNFSLINLNLNEIQYKKNWAMKFIYQTGSELSLGICLKKSIQKKKYSFDSWDDKGHGLYLIRSDGSCFSHSEREFNNVNRSFKFDSNSLIYLEYDPIEWKLRFRKGIKNETFYLSIIPPPQGDSYYPCAAIYYRTLQMRIGWNALMGFQTQVEILPGVPLS